MGYFQAIFARQFPAYYLIQYKIGINGFYFLCLHLLSR